MAGYVVASQRVGLEPVRPEHAALYARWMNDPEVKVGVTSQGLFSEAAEEEWARDCARQAAQREPRVANFTVFDRSDDTPVGTVGLFDISHRHRSCELGIALGARRGQGLGTETVRLALDWAFTVLSLNSVSLTAIAFNDRALRCYERAGFRVVGTRRESLLAAGRLRDSVLMDALASEFTGSVLRPGEIQTA